MDVNTWEALLQEVVAATRANPGRWRPTDLPGTAVLSTRTGAVLVRGLPSDDPTTAVATAAMFGYPTIELHDANGYKIDELTANSVVTSLSNLTGREATFMAARIRPLVEELATLLSTAFTTREAIARGIIEDLHRER